MTGGGLRTRADASTGPTQKRKLSTSKPSARSRVTIVGATKVSSWAQTDVAARTVKILRSSRMGRARVAMRSPTASRHAWGDRGAPSRA
ncbi:MAG TPA: hypothetical protein VF881_03560, partial [Polyangiaceae bacterium]